MLVSRWLRALLLAAALLGHIPVHQDMPHRGTAVRAHQPTGRVQDAPMASSTWSKRRTVDSGGIDATRTLASSTWSKRQGCV